MSVLIEGVTVRGLIDSGAEITTIDGGLFRKKAAVARLTAESTLSDKITKTYNCETNGRVDLDISFEVVAMQTPLYVKIDAWNSNIYQRVSADNYTLSATTRQ